MLMKRALLGLLSVLFLIETSPCAEKGKAPLGQPYVYKTVGDRELKLYVENPPGWAASDKRPAVVIFHGGGWTKGGPWLFNDQVKYLTLRGLVCVQVEYRLLDKDSKEPPEVCLQDAKSAFRWVRGHADELGVDPDRLAAAGSSAGAHLAAAIGMIAGHDDAGDDRNISAKPQAMVLYNPVIDNGPSGYGVGRVGARFPEFSPFHNVTAETPSGLILTGDKDSLVDASMIREFQKKMIAAGVRCDVVFYPEQGHGFYTRKKAGGKYFAETLIEVDRFLTSLGWLTGEPTITVPAAPSVPSAPETGDDS